MKKSLVCFILLLGIVQLPGVAQSGWIVIPSPTTENLYEIEYHSFTASDWVMGANGTLFKTSDHGETWETMNPGTTADIKGRHGPASFQDWIVGSAGTVLISFDLGVTWEPRQPGPVENFNTIISGGSGVAYVAGDNGKVYFSDDMGINWGERSVSTYETLLCGIGPTSGTSLHALVGGTNGVIFKTTDAGFNWTGPISGTSNAINCFDFGPSGVLFAVGDGGTILKTNDAGDTWAPVLSPTTEHLYSIDGSGQNSSWIVICGANGTLLKSTDAGANWFEQVSPTTEHLYSVVALTNNVHLAVGANGIIIKTEDGGTPVGINDNVNPLKDISVSQNYPNPFYQETTIEFSLPWPGFVTLTCFNILGEEVAALESNMLDAGQYSYNWDTGDLEGGIYFYKFEVNGSSMIKKCLLLN